LKQEEENNQKEGRSLARRLIAQDGSIILTHEDGDEDALPPLTAASFSGSVVSHPSLPARYISSHYDVPAPNDKDDHAGGIPPMTVAFIEGLLAAQ
jgi:hypothetical protein